VWFVDYAGGFLGRLDTSTGAVREWATPSGTSARPYATALDDKGRIWFVESGPDPNQFVGFDPATEKFFSVTPIGSGGGTVRHMHFHPPTRTIWFGTDTNTIGRATVP
jgi:virginiamycin B lyase